MRTKTDWESAKKDLMYIIDAQNIFRKKIFSEDGMNSLHLGVEALDYIIEHYEDVKYSL